MVRSQQVECVASLLLQDYHIFLNCIVNIRLLYFSFLAVPFFDGKYVNVVWTLFSCMMVYPMEPLRACHFENTLRVSRTIFISDLYLFTSKMLEQPFHINLAIFLDRIDTPSPK